MGNVKHVLSRLGLAAMLVLACAMLKTAANPALGADAVSQAELEKLRQLAVEDPWEASDKDGQALISRIGSRTATRGDGNKMVTFNGKTHIVWQDWVEDRYYAQIRTLDRSSGEWSPTYTISKADWDHTRPNIAVDSRGYLHVVTREQYTRSVHPNDASRWTEPVELYGRYECYPGIVCGPDDTLYVITGQNPGHVGMDFYVKPAGKNKWDYRGMLFRKPKEYKHYAAYHHGIAWGPDHRTLHMSTEAFMGIHGGRELRGHHQAIVYMRSHDFGKTWEKVDGTPIKLPATMETIDVLEEGKRDPDATDKPRPGIYHGDVVTDRDGRPYVAYVRHTPHPGRLYLKTPDERGRWQELPVQQAVSENWPGMGVIEWFDMTMAGKDVLCLAVELIPLDHPAAKWDPGDGRPADWAYDNPQAWRIGWLESRDGGRTFTARHPVEHDPDATAFRPKMEHPTGFMPYPASFKVEHPTGFNEAPYPASFVYAGRDVTLRNRKTVDSPVYYGVVRAAKR